MVLTIKNDEKPFFRFQNPIFNLVRRKNEVFLLFPRQISEKFFYYPSLQNFEAEQPFWIKILKPGYVYKDCINM